MRPPFYFIMDARVDPQEKGMATHSSILAWRIPWIEGSLMGYNPWGRKDSDTTEQLTQDKQGGWRQASFPGRKQLAPEPRVGLGELPSGERVLSWYPPAQPQPPRSDTQQAEHSRPVSLHHGWCSQGEVSTSIIHSHPSQWLVTTMVWSGWEWVFPRSGDDWLMHLEETSSMIQKHTFYSPPILRIPWHRSLQSSLLSER